MVDPVFGRLVVTTRRRDLVSRKWKGRVWSMELEALETAAARTLLTRGIEQLDVKERDLDQILEKLGGVALALDIANRLAQQSGFKYLFRGLDVDPIGALELYDPVRKEESIRWAFGLSYRSLDHDGKQLFQALGLSPRPFAAGAFARVLDWDERRIGQAFHGLTCVGLVERREAGYWTHSLLHDYARELARGLPVEQVAKWKRRFAAHYLDVTQRAADRWWAGAKKEAVRLWDREMAHIDQGGAYAGELARHDDVMAYWWPTTLYFINVGTSREMVDRWRTHFNTAARDDEWAHGNLVLGMLYTYLNQPDRAVHHFTEAREAVDRTQEKPLWLEITQRMGQAFLAGGRLEKALALVNDQDYVSARNQLPEDSPLFIISLLFEAQIHQMTRNYFEAQECLVVAVELAKDVLDPLTQSDVLLRLGDVLGHLNRWERVVEVSREGMRLGDMDAARPVWSLHAMSEITALLELGRMAEAAERLEQVEDIVRSDPRLESAWLVEYARMQGQRGDWGAAEAAYGEAIEKAYGTLPEADIRFRLGMHLREQGELERAAEVLRETRERARQLGNTSMYLMATYHCAELLMELGQEDEARALAEELLEQWDGDGLAVGALEILGREEEARALENEIARRELEQMSRLTEVEKSGRWRDLL
jgi:tetratricopeptide (TPR) repeat protein